MTVGGAPFWERPEQVERFARREPDARLVELASAVARPEALRVLDLGCAGGRNAAWLAARGFDLLAVDASRAMVASTRRRLAPLVGEAEAVLRVREARMDDLGLAGDASFDLVVALGVYHCAASRTEWERALAETARVLRPGGRLLASVFAPGTVIDGCAGEPVPGEPGVHLGFPGGRAFLVDGETLDRDLARRGLVPELPTRTVRPEGRVTVNGLYVRRAGAGVSGEPGSRARAGAPGALSRRPARAGGRGRRRSPA